MDSPQEIPTMCGFCYPDVDFDAYVHVACTAHTPDLNGPEDEIAKRRFGSEWITGTGEAGGVGNQAICEDIHHRRE